VDWVDGPNIPYIQFLSLAIPRQFLPIVGFTQSDAVLDYLMDNTAALLI
jgi:hypothetical protein